jgi:hypothetical protein
MSITGLTVNIKDVVGTETEDTENHNTKNTIEVTVETRPERNTISAMKRMLVYKT